MKKIFIDTETTALEPGEIIQLTYCICDINKNGEEKVSLSKNFFFDVDYIEPSAEAVHGFLDVPVLRVGIERCHGQLGLLNRSEQIRHRLVELRLVDDELRQRLLAQRVVSLRDLLGVGVAGLGWRLRDHRRLGREGGRAGRAGCGFVINEWAGGRERLKVHSGERQRCGSEESHRNESKQDSLHYGSPPSDW